MTEFKQKNGLVFKEDETKKKLTEKEQDEALSGLSNLIVQAAVLSAIALKKSAIPGTQKNPCTIITFHILLTVSYLFKGIMSKVMQATKDGLLKIDETCSIRERTLNLTSVGISKAIELDQHYEVHQFFAELFYTGCSAILKASIAYAEHGTTTTTATTTTSI